MAFIVYNKNNFSKIAVTNTLQKATNILPNDSFDILEMEDSNLEIYKENNEIKTKTKQIETIDPKQLILNQLEELDKKSIRDSEDLCDVLISKGIIKDTDVPFIKQRKEQKQNLRNQLKQLD